jgi:hypothetical protein
MGKRMTGVGKNKASRSKKTKKRLAVKSARMAAQGKTPKRSKKSKRA